MAWLVGVLSVHQLSGILLDILTLILPHNQKLRGIITTNPCTVRIK